MKLPAGLVVQLVASEPMIRQPVAMEFDENGRIFVAEDRGYPLNTKERIGRIILLEDTNGVSWTTVIPFSCSSKTYPVS